MIVSTKGETRKEAELLAQKGLPFLRRVSTDYATNRITTREGATPKIDPDQNFVFPILGNCLRVRAKPKSRKTQLSKVEDDTVFIDIAAPPEDNKANLELLKFLKRQTGRPCKIKSGATSKDKIVIFD